RTGRASRAALNRKELQAQNPKGRDRVTRFHGLINRPKRAWECPSFLARLSGPVQCRWGYGKRRLRGARVDTCSGDEVAPYRTLSAQLGWTRLPLCPDHRGEPLRSGDRLLLLNSRKITTR